ncbi:MAG: crotonyl-CoA carboxylase/reductase [Gammaproteobacteria bacterium]|nr:crotonyl-CoA carboxylase/reductase [Gammaproteobacteria bacterium]MCP5424862.1 crotonyl-CoA carboxylase/reductase [Gammaproteobacteria bacterium]MCP5458161.1 crotonyl-CoA carboxylase/reductase [Gammaproteobacteria bacterium]
MTKELYDLGEAPPVGEVPAKMHAYLIRADRFGPPTQAFQREVVPVPEISDDEVLVYVMAAGINYNNVWAGLGLPVDVIKARNKQGEPEDFHIGGSDASGIVYKIGKNVKNVRVGQEVVIHCGMWDVHDPWVVEGGDPMYSQSFRIWGYESNYGSFAQFTKVNAEQCLPKPGHLSWEGSAAYMLVGATAYRMLRGWDTHAIRKGDVALIWGGAGGLGSMAIQICRALGAIPIAIVSGTDKFEYCKSLGAVGCINRNDFDHWGMLPHWKDNVGYNNWLKGVRKFGAAIWDVLGEKRAPRLIFEHPGETTIPTSLFVCDTGGMVVICAGTTGYNATVDLRYLWMRQKRVQGSHFANTEQAAGLNRLVLQNLVDPCLSKAFSFDELAQAHQLMYENKHPHGNMAVLVGATDFGMGITDSDLRLAEHEALAADDKHNVPPNPFPMSSPTVIASNLISEHLDEPELNLVDDGTLVKDLMHAGLISCSPSTSLEEAVGIMVDNDIHAIVVMEGKRAVGVVSQTDMVLARQGRTAEDARKMTAGDVMTPGCATCTANTKLTTAVSTMTGRRIHRLVVTDDDVPVGMISMTDVVRKMLLDDNK